MIEKLIAEMIQYYAGDAPRIQHFMKVHDFSRTIAILEGMDQKTLFTLEAAAVVHDIGIHISEKKYGSCAGSYQELEGPPLAQEMLSRLGFPPEVTRRVSYLVGHHHTYSNIDGADYQILVEADFLVNLFEDNSPKSAVESALNNIFRTKTSIRFCREMFGLIK
ncbi:MAG: phosphohydrolase [Clostridiales bacterium]|nr:phosphohydrolase [Clostridiales bacterium]